MEKMSTSEQVEEPPSLLGEAPASWSGALGPTVLSSSDRAASESGHWLGHWFLQDGPEDDGWTESEAITVGSSKHLL